MSSQAAVDFRACIDECRLNFILKCNDEMRAENLQGVVDVVDQGMIDGSEVGKKNILPSTYTGDHRYMYENFQDVVAISRVHGSPDVFTTFTCNPKWDEILDSVEPRQTAIDRADIAVRVYHMKLIQYLHRIKKGNAFGPIVAGTVPCKPI